MKYSSRLQTNASGIIDVTFPTGRFTEVPVVMATVETPTSEQATMSYRVELIGTPTALACKLRVTKVTLSKNALSVAGVGINVNIFAV